MSTKGQRKRSAAITGAGSGLGRDIALGLAAKGYRVFGTAISSEEIADLKKASGGAVNLSQCDITNEAAVKVWANEVTIQTEGGLDPLTLFRLQAGSPSFPSRRSSTPSVSLLIRSGTPDCVLRL